MALICSGRIARYCTPSHSTIVSTPYWVARSLSLVQVRGEPPGVVGLGLDTCWALELIVKQLPIRLSINTIDRFTLILPYLYYLLSVLLSLFLSHVLFIQR